VENKREGQVITGLRERMIKKFKVRVDGKEYYVEVEGVEEEKATLTTTVQESVPGKGSGVRDGDTPGKQASLAATGTCIRAPMPGAVVKIN